MKQVYLFFLFFSSIVFSQNYSQTLIKNTPYFHELQQEKFFLHTNKTTYFTGETIWWKAYVVSDFNNKPTTATTNLYVNFFDENKKLISSNLYYCEDGLALGEIQLPKKFVSGTYYIQLDTQWNKNFTSKYTFPLTLINSEQNKVETDNKEVKESLKPLSLEFYPESGSLLNNKINWVYTSLKLENLALPEQEIRVFDSSTNKEIAKIKTNSLGHAKFAFLCKPGHSYVAKVNFNNVEHKFQLNLAKNSGIIIHKKQGLKAKGIQEFVVEFSDDLLINFSKETFFVTVHRNNKLLYVLPFEISKNKSKYLLPLDKENLFNGFNTLTLFNKNNEPVAERHFYVTTKKQIDLNVSQTVYSKDSLILDFDLSKDYKNANLSISVLPKDTKLNNGTNSILDAFLLQPYVSSLASINKFNDSELDILLQTQVIKRKINYINSEKAMFDFEHGLELIGSVNGKVDKNYKVLLSSKESGILETTSIDKDKKFSFSNLVLKHDNDFKLALLNEKGEIVDGGFYVYKRNKKYSPDKFLTANKMNQLIISNNIQKKEIEHNYFEYEKMEMLDEVHISAEVIKEPIESAYPTMSKEIGGSFFKNLQISQVESLTLTVIQYLNRQVNINAREGALFNKERDSTSNVSFSSVGFTRGINSFHGGRGALIIVDNIIGMDGDLLHNLSLSEVKSISVNPSGAGYGMRGSGGVIKIDLKDGAENFKTTPNPYYFNSTTDFGFTPSQSIFKNNQFVFNSQDSRNYYETLDWIPFYNVHSNEKNILKIFKGNHKNIKLFINGMDKEGSLIYKIIDLTVQE